MGAQVEGKAEEEVAGKVRAERGPLHRQGGREAERRPGFHCTGREAPPACAALRRYTVVGLDEQMDQLMLCHLPTGRKQAQWPNKSQ